MSELPTQRSCYDFVAVRCAILWSAEDDKRRWRRTESSRRHQIQTEHADVCDPRPQGSAGCHLPARTIQTGHEHRVLDAEGQVVAPLGRADWADWSGTGELLFARDGRLYRMDHRRGELSQPEELV